MRSASLGASIDQVEWLLLFVLWAPVLGALVLRGSIDDPARRSSALTGYLRAALLLHPLALPPLLVSYEVGLFVLAAFDAVLLVIVWATWRDERTLGDVIEALRDPARVHEGAQHAERWMRELATRRGAESIRADHALACARALADAGRVSDAESALESVPRGALAPRDATRIHLALALLALERGDTARARPLVARALGRAPLGVPEIVTARAAWALLDAIDGLSRRALSGLARVASPGSDLDRGLIALARAHVLASRGETAAARELLRVLDRGPRAQAERFGRACVGPASTIAGSIDHAIETPYR